MSGAIRRHLAAFCAAALGPESTAAAPTATKEFAGDGTHGVTGGAASSAAGSRIVTLALQRA